MSFPANVIPVFGSQRAYADLNFSGGSFGLDGRIVNDLTALPGFTFTRASLAMGYDATGKLTYGPNNLCLQSQTFDNASWTKTNSTITANAVTSPDGTATADAIVDDATNADHKVRQSISVTSGTVYTLSVYAKANTLNYVWLYAGTPNVGKVFNLATGAVLGNVGGAPTSAEITAVGNGWYRCAITYTAGATSAQNQDIGVSQNGTTFNYVGTGQGVYLWQAQLEAVTYQTTPSTYMPTTTAAYYGPRLVYDPVTLASQGILVEEARTNLCLQSQTFDNATWSKTNITVTADATTAPDGTSTADKAEATTTGATSLNQIATGGGSTTGSTGSVFAKQGSSATAANRFTFRDNTAGTNLLQFQVNYSTGAIIYTTGSSGVTVTNVGNGWWRIAATAAAASNGNNMRLYAGFDSAATAGDFVYLWGAQIEAGTGASSPIPTTTASVTRAADVAAVTGLSVPAPLSLVSSGGMTNATATTRYMAQVDAGSSANIVLNYLNTANLRRCFVQTASVTQADISVSSAVAVGDQWTIASRFQTDNVRPSTAGVLGTADTSATMPAGLANLRIGTDGTGGQFNGTISRIRIFNRALSDAQLQSLTS